MFAFVFHTFHTFCHYLTDLGVSTRVICRQYFMSENWDTDKKHALFSDKFLAYDILDYQDFL